MYGVMVNNNQKLCVRHVMIMCKKLDIYGAFRYKTVLHEFPLKTDDPIIGWKD